MKEDQENKIKNKCIEALSKSVVIIMLFIQVLLMLYAPMIDCILASIIMITLLIIMRRRISNKRLLYIMFVFLFVSLMSLTRVNNAKEMLEMSVTDMRNE